MEISRYHKSALPSQSISQLQSSLQRAEVHDITHLLGVDSRVLVLDPRNSTITGTHKGWSYAGMILAAYERGEIDENTLITEFTSGRGGEAAAKIAKLLGLRSEIAMPEGITPEREQILTRLSKLVLTPQSQWLRGSMDYAWASQAEEPHRFVINQSGNYDNVRALTSLIRKALTQIDQVPNFLVSTVGTGGTAAAFGLAADRATSVIGIDPVESPSTQAFKEGWIDRFQHRTHSYWGSGAGAASPLVQRYIGAIDQVVTVDWQEALNIAKWLGERGLNVGLSTGGNIRACLDLAKQHRGATLMTVIHDTAEVYRSMGL